jgi:3-deoxy-D-manno-octulosonic-acid transferase
VVAAFRRRHPDVQCVISTTTDTGFDEAHKHFPDLPVISWPLDFTWAVRRALREVHPSLVVLVEGEIWPNFLLAARRQGVPVAVINGRMSPKSFARARWLRRLFRNWYAGIDLFAVQTDAYAARFCDLGADPGRVNVTNSVKYDGVSVNRANPRTLELGKLLAVQPDDLVWIAGSTQAPEEELALGIYARLKRRHPRLRLFLVPRQKERFDEVANLLRRWGGSWLRRSELQAPLTDLDDVVLVDTIGELGALWGLADIAFVGGSLDGQRGGQNMIEPAAYGGAVIFGPHVWNFQDTASRLTEARAAVQVGDAAGLEAAVDRLCRDARERARLGRTARQLVQEQQGATEVTLQLLDKLLSSRPARPHAA